eukprot:766773-Hanusia_phi.AAC.3
MSSSTPSRDPRQNMDQPRSSLYAMLPIEPPRRPAPRTRPSAPPSSSSAARALRHDTNHHQFDWSMRKMFWSLVLIQSITLGIFVSFMCKTMSPTSVSPLPHTIMDDIREKELKYFKTKDGMQEATSAPVSQPPKGRTAWVSRYLYPELWDNLPQVKAPPKGPVDGPASFSSVAENPARSQGSLPLQHSRAEPPAVYAPVSMSTLQQLECAALKEDAGIVMSLELTGDLPQQMLQYLFARTWASVRGAGVIKKFMTTNDHLRLSFPGVVWSKAATLTSQVNVDSSVCGGVFKRNYLYHYRSRNLAKCLFAVPTNFAVPNEVVIYFEGRNVVSFDALKVQTSRDYDLQLMRRMSPDVMYYKSAIEHVMRTLGGQAMISIVCEPKFFLHPTVLQLKQLWNTRMVHVNTFSDLNRAMHAVAFIGSFGELSWMSAFLTEAKQIHLPYWSDLDEQTGGKISDTLGTWPKLFIHDDERLCYWDLNQPTSCSKARHVLAAHHPFSVSVHNRSDECLFRQEEGKQETRMVSSSPSMNPNDLAVSGSVVKASAGESLAGAGWSPAGGTGTGGSYGGLGSRPQIGGDQVVAAAKAAIAATNRGGAPNFGANRLQELGTQPWEGSGGLNAGMLQGAAGGGGQASLIGGGQAIQGGGGGG